MTERSLKRLLAVSLVLNLFLIGAGAGGSYMAVRALREKAQNHAPPPPPVLEVANKLKEPENSRLREVMRDAALEAAPDFKQAREARRKAVELASAATFDQKAVQAEVERARSAEIAGRRKLESALLNFMSGLSAEERAQVAPVLRRIGVRKSKAPRPDRPHQGGAEAPASVPRP